MKSFYIFFLLVNLSFTQIYTIHHVSEGTVIDKIEENLIHDVFDLLGKKKKVEVDYNWHSHESFQDLISYMKRIKPDKAKYDLAISSITITNNRKLFMDFSHPYVPTREVLISKNDRSDKFSKEKIAGAKIGYNKGTIQERSIKALLKKYKFNAIIYETHKKKENDLLNGKLDFILGDNINVWNNNKMRIVMELEFQNGNGFGIAFPKKSTIKAELDPIIKYYLRSAKFRKLTSDYFSAEVSEYFAKALFSN